MLNCTIKTPQTSENTETTSKQNHLLHPSKHQRIFQRTVTRSSMIGGGQYGKSIPLVLVCVVVFIGVAISPSTLSSVVGSGMQKKRTKPTATKVTCKYACLRN